MSNLTRTARKTVAVLAVVGAFALTPSVAAGSMSQSCTGVMVKGEDGTHLALDASGAQFPGVSWCDSPFVGALEARALASCPLGSTCRVKGFFEGHGVFYWTKITSIKRVK
jgi:hypothetical protein